MMVVAGEVVGICGYHGPPSSDGDIEIGYNVAPRRRRLGYATAAVGRVIELARGDSAIDAVIAHTGPENIGSQRALLRNRFERVIREAPPGGEIRWRSALRRPVPP